jgi:excisionase family DNA binding protein
MYELILKYKYIHVNIVLERQESGEVLGRDGGDMETDKLLSIEEGAVQLGISPLTMRAWIRQRRLPYIQLGRRILLDPKDVQRFIDANRMKAVSFSGRD